MSNLLVMFAATSGAATAEEPSWALPVVLVLSAVIVLGGIIFSFRTKD
jgi:hypothetical protein